MGTELNPVHEKKTILYGPNGGGKSQLIRSLSKDKQKAVMIDESRVRQIGVRIFDRDEFTFEDFAIVDPDVAGRLYLETYYNMVRDPDRGWIYVKELSYGQRRRLAIEAALEGANIGKVDFVAIENFESGLHVDYIVELIKLISEIETVTIIIETHSGLVLKIGMRYGIPIYYVDGQLKRVDRLDDYQLFSRELSAFHAIVI
jgi:ABC-type multidrug transport system ATPase subunit